MSNNKILDEEPNQEKKASLTNLNSELIPAVMPANSSRIGSYLHTTPSSSVGQSFAVKMTDESLASADIHIGDVVIAEVCNTPLNSALFVASFKPEMSMRKLRVLEIAECDCIGIYGGFHMIQPDSPGKFYCSRSEEFKLVGKVTKIDKRSSIFDCLMEGWNGSERHAYFTCNPGGNYFQVSEDFLRLTNLKLEYATYGGVLHVMHTDDRRNFEIALENGLKDGKSIINHHCRLLTRNNKYIRAIISATPVLRSNQVVQWHGVIKLVGEPKIIRYEQQPVQTLDLRLISNETTEFDLIG